LDADFAAFVFLFRTNISKYGIRDTLIQHKYVAFRCFSKDFFSLLKKCGSQEPLATVVVGGLITSTLLTLLIIPSVYSWFEKRTVEGEK